MFFIVFNSMKKIEKKKEKNLMFLYVVKNVYN